MRHISSSHGLIRLPYYRWWRWFISVTNIALISEYIRVEGAAVKFNIFFLLLPHPNLEIILLLFMVQPFYEILRIFSSLFSQNLWLRVKLRLESDVCVIVRNLFLGFLSWVFFWKFNYFGTFLHNLVLLRMRNLFIESAKGVHKLFNIKCFFFFATISISLA